MSLLDFETLLKYDGMAPRYTSYPPANYFTQDPDQADYEGMLRSSNRSGSRNLSLYVHIPFCPRRCLFCGCHTEVGRAGEFIKDYLETLFQEFRLLLPYLDRSRPVTQVHFGGGTPNAVPFAPLERLLQEMSLELALDPSAEIAMECDPSLILPSTVEKLRRIGFNRLSFGIQDLDPRVLQAVDRRPSRMPVKELVQTCRDLGFRGINLDLIHGLPFQTPESFRGTVEGILAADPDRISLFPYAHVPWMKGHQASLQRFPMPDARDRLRMAMDSRGILLEAGYVAIGMDHFVKPDDDLALAQQQGRLHRNFQGYCSLDQAGQVYALGASGISQLHTGYLQNEKELDQYRAKVEEGRLPIRAVYRMTPRDQAVRSIINDLLCRGRVDLRQALSSPDLEPEWITDYALAGRMNLAPFLLDGLAVEKNDDVIITEKGFPLARIIAAAFDPLQRAESGQPRYSRAL